MNDSPKYSLTWPPIIQGAKRSVVLRARDLLLTMLCWLILINLLEALWVLIYKWLKPPIFTIAPEDIPDWLSIWEALYSFVLATGFIVAGVLIAAIWRRNVIGRTIEQHYLSQAEEVDLIYRQEELLPSQIEEWHRLNNVDVFLDDQGHIINAQEIVGCK